ncbi:MAG: homoserine dehydrogenase [Lachnospiraceae bacterium]|nr:homoserine dehydrogenase [Lachnospiraceae bacterium]MBR1650041.1 homoserine dehydrogenase [Lachnospiraceae bacterium]
MVKVAVLGYGTVGSGVVQVIEDNCEVVSKKSGTEVRVKYILDLRDFPGDPYEKLVVHDFNTILEDPEVNVVCETMGGVGAAYNFSKQCLLAGKSVCTSNKELVAKHGPELLQIAKEHDCSYLFEASVGGGIPIIRPIMDALAAEKLESILGILNGTTNYILTKMEKEGADFDTVLKEAQMLGYAERNPEADVEGHDACRKISILASLMLGKTVDSEKVYTEGITKITSDDFEFAKKAGYTIKILGVSKAQGSGAALVYVSPFFIKKSHPLAMVNDVFNGIFVTGNMVGDTMYYGKGAGKLPTASAVVADVIDAARHVGKNVPCYWDAEEADLADIKEASFRYFVRVKADSLEQIKGIAPGGKVVDAQVSSQAGYITPVLSEKVFAEVQEKLGDGILGRIRVYDAK